MTNNRKTAIYIAPLLILSGILLPRWWLVASVPCAAIIITIYDRQILNYLGSWKFFSIFLLGSLILPLLGGGNSVSIYGIEYSLNTMFIGLKIVCRGFMVFCGMSLIRRHIHPDTFTKWLWKMGMHRLAVIIPLAFHILPALLESLFKTIDVWRQRGGLRKHRLRNIILLLTSIQVQFIREAENLAIALTLAQKNNPPNKTIL